MKSNKKKLSKCYRTPQPQNKNKIVKNLTLIVTLEGGKL
jgi:hypothetical protein